jgi:CheY-like chemotaxis protein
MPGTGTQKTVLVVEDEVGVRRMLTKLLGAKGFRTIEAGNGREAIEHLARETPAAIVIDLLMPIMSGVELLKALRRNAYFRAIPTIVLTGVAEPREVVALGVPVILKPDLGKLPEMLLEMTAARDAVIASEVELLSTPATEKEVASTG